MKGNTAFKWVGWIFTLIGVGLAIGAVFAAFSGARLAREGVHTTGNVVDFTESTSEDGTLMYAPVFTFLDEQGQQHRIQSRVSSSPPGYSKGQIIELVYPPGQPEKADVASWFGVWGVAFILGIIAVVFIPVGILLLVKLVPAIASGALTVTTQSGFFSDENS